MTNEAVARTRPASRTRETLRPTLHLIEGKIPQRSVIPLALLAIAILLAAIVVPLVVNTQMAETAFELREMQLEVNALDAEAWTLQTQLHNASSPQALEKSARDLGMVPAGPTGFVTLSNGTVEGGQAAFRSE